MAGKKTDTASGFTVKMTHNKSTKGTHVYAAAADGAQIRTLYIANAAFEGDPPASIEVAVSY